jgi:protein-S-isoprenylcysteine O-methyltransferase Ste14
MSTLGLTILRHTASILVLPTTVTVVVPFFILVSPRYDASAIPTSSGLGLAMAIVGIATIASGLVLIVVTIWQFATRGRGTLAPWDPPKHLVTTGVYRYVRNPMISGVVLILFGEAMVSRSTSVLEWAVGFFVVNAIYIPLLEEPLLEQRFGDDYRRYTANVPRWVPRTTPWEPPAEP